MNVRTRHHVVETGPPTGRVVLLAHGFGCDQHMWRLVAPRLAETFRVARAPDVVEALIELLPSFGDGLDDDVAILAIGIPPPQGESSPRS